MKKAKIYYFTLTDEMRKEEKLAWFSEMKFEDIPFEHIQPDKNGNWIDIPDNDWEELIPVSNKETKLAKSKSEEKAVFKLNSIGVVTARDEWVYDYKRTDVEKKVKHLIDIYNLDVVKLKGKSKNEIKDEVDYSIKWSRAVKNDLFKAKIYKFDQSNIIKTLFRPFTKKYLYFARELNEMQYQNPMIFPNSESKNLIISVNIGNPTFATLSSDKIQDLATLKFGNGGTYCLPLYRYGERGNRIENITDWGLSVFREKYGKITNDELLITNEKKPKGKSKNAKVKNKAVSLGERWNADPLGKSLHILKEGDLPALSRNRILISKIDIFCYTYGVLHNPAYRKKYELNLKREFPRLPFYEDFYQWRDWGKELMDLHIGFEKAEKYKLKIHDTGYDKAHEPKAKLRANKEEGIIILDEKTELHGVPAEAWDYKLGNRSALEWILDQYKEKKPRDPTIREKFNTYRFADYKEKVIELLMRVCTVSVETVRIVKEMEKD